MATLQKIRSKGPLLVIVIGLALFAFIAGDAWKVLQPHQGKQEVGEINGKSLSAQDFQKMMEEYSDIVKLTSGASALTDDQLTRIKDQVWQSYVNSQLIEHEAERLGLTVSDEEIKAIIEQGTDPMLQNTPFRNPQTGAFDKDILKKFLADYAKMDKSQMPAQYLEYYESMNKFWLFVEKELRQSHLAQKYQNLLSKAMLSNPVEAQAAFDSRATQYDVLLAAVPYSSIADSTVSVSDSELKSLYNEKKEQFRQYTETRNIKYIDITVRPSEADRAAVREEVTEYANQMAQTSEYAAFIRSTGSEVAFSDLYCNKTVYPTDVVSRLDSVAVGEVYGPYYNQADDSFNAFKVLGKQSQADSIRYRQIQVYAETEAKTRALADSIYGALRAGADFTELAQRYNNNPAEAQWLVGSQYESANLDADNVRYVNTLCNLGKNEIAKVDFGQASVVMQVVDKRATTQKYKVAVVKRPVQFSKETYNKAYNEFSQFVASNNTLEKMAANAEENGYRLLERNDFYSSEHALGGVKGTKEAIRWIFDAKVGAVSPLYECGESDHLMVVALTGIHKEGYRAFDDVKDQLRAEAIRDKKAEQIIRDLKGKNLTSFADYAAQAGMRTDSVKHISFSAPTYVAMTRGSEPVLGAYASVSEVGQLSAPIKGNSGVYVLQVYNKEARNETFDATREAATLKNQGAYRISRFTNDLYLKAHVKDSRYLFF